MKFFPLICLTGFLVLALFASDGANGCGMIMHMETSLRALHHVDRFIKNKLNIDVRQFLLKHQAAYQTGAIYPDVFYAPLCFKQKYVNYSIITHQQDYIIAALDYFKENYMGEYTTFDEEGEELLAFILGNVAHNTQDKAFHGYGIDQGFLSTISEMNFNGDFQKAHRMADFGGDAVSLYEYNFVNLHLATSQWFIPQKHLLEIYQRMAGEDIKEPLRTKGAMLFCTGTTMARTLVHKMLIHRFYVAYGMKSPLLVSPHFHDYFVGGMSDMAYWTLERLETAIRYLENSSTCELRGRYKDNPLYWTCGDQPKLVPPPESWMTKTDHYKSSKKHDDDDEQRKVNYMSKMFSMTDDMIKGGLFGTEEDMIETTEDKNSAGFYFRPKGALRRALQESTLNDLFEYGETQRQVKSNDEQTDAYADHSKDSYQYHVKKPYSLIGQSMVSADLNNDSADDLVVGVPGYSEDNRFEEGRVYVVLADQRGIPSENLDLENSPNSQVISAPFKGTGRFGYAITVLDFNSDSIPDLAISAPIRSEDVVEKPYSGFVYVYYGSADGIFKKDPDVTIDCDMRYCNYGTTLSTGDLEHEESQELVIGSPFASLSFEKSRQNGFVSVFYADKHHKKVYKGYKKADIVVWGLSPYSWFGYSAIATKNCDLLIGAPGQKTPSADDERCNPTVQMAGTVYCYSAETRGLSIFARGSKEFEFFGAQLAEGYPNGRNSDPVIAIGAPNSDNMAKLVDRVPYKLRQSGTVYLYNSNSHALISQFIGDRLYSSFGRMLKFVKVDSDDYDDLLIGAPMRASDYFHMFFGEGVGELYLYYGSETFPTTALNRKCPKKFFEPCPEHQADGTFSSNVRRAQIGSNAVLLRSANVTQLVVAAQRSDDYARMSGKLLIFNNCLLLP